MLSVLEPKDAFKAAEDILLAELPRLSSPRGGVCVGWCVGGKPGRRARGKVISVKGGARVVFEFVGILVTLDVFLRATGYPRPRFGDTLVLLVRATVSPAAAHLLFLVLLS